MLASAGCGSTPAQAQATRGIVREIQRQTGADLFEITLVEPYSNDYNTVLMEAQRDRHDKARPEIAQHIDNMDEYDTILLGYPNWWASIPMPIASFLEEYDFSGKQIIPFCSHGGDPFRPESDGNRQARAGRRHGGRSLRSLFRRQRPFG